MKLKTALLFLVTIALVACNNKNKSNEIANYTYSDEVKFNKLLEERVGDWITQGIDCYGILVMTNSDDVIVSARPVSVKAMHLSADAIKVKANERVSLAPKEGCNVMGLEKGDTWWEKEGDLFKTYDEAVVYCKDLIRAGREKNMRFTID